MLTPLTRKQGLAFAFAAGVLSTSSLFSADVAATMDNGGAEDFVLDGGVFTDTSAILGTTSNNNVLTIQNGGYLAVDDSFTVSAISGTGNQITVTGAGSSLDVGSSLYLGYASESYNNTLSVEAGGSLTSANLYVGSDGDTNSVTVTGADSFANISTELLVGYYGEDNSVTVSDGALFISKKTTLGTYTAANGNSVTVTGAGTNYINRGDFTVGYRGDSNGASVLDGAYLSTRNLVLGTTSDSEGNSVTISGAGSTVAASGYVAVGYQGINNTMQISSGGTLSGGNIYVGYMSDGNNNSLTVDGTGSRALTTGTSGSIYVGNSGSNNTMTVRNNASMSTYSLVVGGTGSGNTLNIQSGASVIANDLFFGLGGGSNNTLNISGASGVTISNLVRVGFSNAGNELNISGQDSILSVGGTLYVGVSGNANSLTMEDSSLVKANALDIASGSSVRISGAYLALAGDQLALLNGYLTDGSILYWDYTSSSWQTATVDKYTLAYCDADADGLELTGGIYSDLGGYTILTAVPEPSTYAMLGGLAVLGYAVARRRKAHA